jgi:hypothetical protein
MALVTTTGAPDSLVNAGVAHVRKELFDHFEEYDKIADCLKGETAVKRGLTKYLPMPNATDTSSENQSRYNAYVERAVFYNATRRTLAGLLGEIFAVDPVIEVPPELDVVIADATGGGVTAIQEAINAAHNVLAYSRTGIFIDYPDLSTPASRAQVEKGEVRPTLKIYGPKDVINWRTVTRGAKILLSLVVLQEKVEAPESDGFATRTTKQWRVLRLRDDVYRVEIWSGEPGVVNAPVSTFTPLDADGKPFDEIPFKFIGSKNNDTVVDEPLLYDLASLNLAHYRNSADHEEASFIVGQPTYWFAGLTKDWVDTVLKKRVETGSRAAVALPEKGSAGILQPDPNTLPREGMEHKERQMVALGAKLVENRSVQRTATETTMDQRTENSILSTAANNVSDAFTWALQFAAKFVGVASDAIKFRLNTEFAIQKLSPEDQQALIASWQAHAITDEEMRSGLRKSGIATETDAEALPKLKKAKAEDAALEMKKLTAKAAVKPAAKGSPPRSRTPAKKAA